MAENALNTTRDGQDSDVAPRNERRGRLQPSTQTRIRVWAAAAGRCTFCNRLVAENGELGTEVPIGELAHIVGWGAGSPRGDADLDENARRLVENLILACRNCHKPIDDGGVVGLYSIQRLMQLKGRHESRIRRLTEIGADRAAHVVRVVGLVRGTHPELTRSTVLEAVTSADLFPQILPNAHWEDIDLDLRSHGRLDSPSDFRRHAVSIDDLAARVNDGVRRDAITRIALFAVAHIPLLVYLGAKLDDKVRVLPFQRHRTDGDNPWIWPDEESEPATFSVVSVRSGTRHDRVALLLSLSGTIRVDELPASIDSTWTVYEIRPDAPSETGPGLIASQATLANFEGALRRFLAMIEERQGKIPSVALFPAIPVSAAIQVGRTLMPQVSPSWRVFDRDDGGTFMEVLEVTK